MTFKRTYTQFTAADAARITGLSQDEQRDWRKRGFLPPVEGGKAKFDVGLLAGILVAKKLNDAGIGPMAGWVLARSCGVMILTRLMNSRRGVVDEYGTDEPMIHGTGGRVNSRWAITTDGRSWGYADTLEDLLPHLSDLSVVLDLDKLADRLVERAGRPLMVISADEAEG